MERRPAADTGRITRVSVRSRPADTLQRWEARTIASAKRAGTNDGTALRPSPPEPPKPTDALPALRVYP
jgi:hypothetical protein